MTKKKKHELDEYYFSVPGWILSYDMTSTSKLILMRALNLSRKDPSQEKFLTNSDLAFLLCISERTVVNSFKELKAEGFVKIVRNPNDCEDNTRYFLLTEKALMNNEQFIKYAEEIEQKYNLDTENNAPIEIFSSSEINSVNLLKKMRGGSAKIALSSSKNIDKRKNKRERALCSIISLSGLIKLFKDTAKVMSKEHPLAQTLNLKHVAEKFYTIKASATFETDKALNSAVTKWLLDEIEHEMNSGKKSSASNQVDAFTAMERFSQFINSRNEKSITTGTDYALKSITKKE